VAKLTFSLLQGSVCQDRRSEIEDQRLWTRFEGSAQIARLVSTRGAAGRNSVARVRGRRPVPRAVETPQASNRQSHALCFSARGLLASADFATLADRGAKPRQHTCWSMPVLPVDLLSLLRGVRFNAGLNCNKWPEGFRSLYALSLLHSVGTVAPVPVRVGRSLQQTDGALEGTTNKRSTQQICYRDTRRKCLRPSLFVDGAKPAKGNHPAD
jgi:hypothetical protein